MAAPTPGQFRFAAKKVGLTYSCPVSCNPGGEHVDGCDCENPLNTLWIAKELLSCCEQWGAVEDWLWGREEHQNGKYHFHAYVKFKEKVDTRSCHYFDLCGVHPNIVSAPGKGWIAYCAKHKEFVTNFFMRDPFSAAFEMSPESGLNHLRQTRPRDVALQGQNIIANLRAARRRRVTRTIYLGPYRSLMSRWDQRKTLVMISSPGWGKTQLACYWAAHLFGTYFYCKGSLECLRHYHGELCIIYDDIKVNNYVNLEWDDVFDVESGGMITARYRDIPIPAVPKFWLQNPGIMVPDEHGRIFDNDRRAQVWMCDH